MIGIGTASHSATTGGTVARGPRDRQRPCVGVCIVIGICIPFAVHGPGASSSRFDSRPDVCQPRAWTPPKLALGGSAVVVRFPRLAVGGARNYLVGVGLQKLDGQVIENGPLIVAELFGRSLGRPRGRFTYLFPRAAVEPNGDLRLVWAEPRVVTDLIAAQEWVFQDPVSIWTATYNRKVGWAAPAQLEVTTGRFDWTAHGGADNFGSLDPTQGIVLKSRQGAAWFDLDLRRHQVEMPRGAAYSSLAFDGQSVYLAYVAAAKDTSTASVGPTARRHEDVNSVFLRRSKDGGRTWEPPRLISLSGRHPAFESTIVVGPRHTVHLIWKQSLPDGRLALRHIESRDGGAEWSRPEDLILSGDLLGARAVVDRCGTVHIVYSDWTDGPGQVRVGYAQWNGRWFRQQAPFIEFLGGMPDLRLDADGSPTVLFVGRVRGDPNAPARTYVSRFAESGAVGP